MTLRRASLLLAAAGLVGVLWGQRPWRELPGREYNDFPLPNDYQDKSEWVFARLMYPPFQGGRGYGYRRSGLRGRLDARLLQLDHRLSARRPPLRAWPCGA